MSYATRRNIERMSAPVVAWLIDNGYIADECGTLEVTKRGRAFLMEGLRNASRHTQGHKPVPMQGV